MLKNLSSLWPRIRSDGVNDALQAVMSASTRETTRSLLRQPALLRKTPSAGTRVKEILDAAIALRPTFYQTHHAIKLLPEVVERPPLPSIPRSLGPSIP